MSWPMPAERLADRVRAPSNTNCSTEMPVRKFDTGSGWFSASMAKLAAVKLRWARSDPNTNTGWFPRCHVSVRSRRGSQPALACLARSDASRWAAAAARVAGFCFSARATASSSVSGVWAATWPAVRPAAARTASKSGRRV